MNSDEYNELKKQIDTELQHVCDVLDDGNRRNLELMGEFARRYADEMIKRETYEILNNQLQDMYHTMMKMGARIEHLEETVRYLKHQIRTHQHPPPIDYSPTF